MLLGKKLQSFKPSFSECLSWHQAAECLSHLEEAELVSRHQEAELAGAS